MNTDKLTKKDTQLIEELEEKAEELYDDEEYEQAVETYRIAAEMGGSYAQYSLGFCYKNGQGVEEDLEEAIKWYKIAAENGNEQAMYELALCLFEECEYRASFDWFAKATEAGEDDAWYYLGWLYFNGEGPEYSPEKAEKCWSNVTNEDQSDLQYKIGHSYECWSTVKKACDETERNKRFEKAVYWMQLAANHGNDSAKKWLKENKAGVAKRGQTASEASAETPSFMNFWNALIESIDGHSGLVFSPDSVISGTTLISNEYLYKDWFFVFSYFESRGMLVSLVIDTDSAKDNNAIANKVNKYLKDNKISTEILNTVSDGKGRTVVLAVDGLDVMDGATYASAIKKTVSFISWVESAWEEIGDAIIQRQKPPLVKIEPENGKSVEYEYDWGKKIHNNVLFRYGSLLIESDISLRDEVLGSLTRDGKSTCMNDWEIIDEDAGDSVSDEWVFPDNEFGQEAEDLYDEDGEEGLESLGLEGTRDMIFFYGPLEIQFMGFPLDSGKMPNLQWSKEMYAPPRTIPCDLFGAATEPIQPKVMEPSKPGLNIKAVGSDTKKTPVSVAPSGPTTKLDFWQAFKPYIDQMRHTEFGKVKIKDDDCLDAKPTVIPGVYNSILMRASKKIMRLELYIDTAEEAKNLEIIDHIKAKMKVPAALKDRIEYERKEGRRAQRVCVSFPDFELSDRSCWAAYMQDILSVADDFFDAVEVPMNDLISGSGIQNTVNAVHSSSSQAKSKPAPVVQSQEQKRDAVPEGMVFVEGGTFIMGSENGAPDEQPEHQVTVSSFYIGKYPVTQKEWETVMGNNKIKDLIAKHGDKMDYGFGDDYPIYFMKWFDAIEYCNRLSMKDGLTPCYSFGEDGTDPNDWPSGWNQDHDNYHRIRCDWAANGYRLPTEAEWEYAARGGKQSKGYQYSGSDDIDSVAWLSDWNSNEHKTHPVGQKKPNELGMYDMSGNVSEWCWDLYGDYPSKPQKDPHGGTNGNQPSFRGGSYYMAEDKASVSGRDYNGAACGEGDYGFRVCRSKL